MGVKIIESSISPTIFNQLRKAVGWEEHELNDIELAFSNNLYMIIAKNEKDDVIGMARIIGDEGLYYYIQDVIVIPEYQNKGIGKSLMRKIMEYIELHKKPNLFVGLMAAKGKEEFYRRIGFIERPAENYGSGMCKEY